MKILIVDDERVQREILRDIIQDQGYSTILAEDGESAIDALHSNDISVILTDLKMPGKDGLAVLDAAISHDETTQVIIMTAFGSIPGAVSAIKKGAYDYLTKPFQKDDLLRILNRAIEKHQLLKDNYRLQAEVEEKFAYGNIIGKDPAMLQIFNMIDRVKDIDATCLISGESGTGKELVARAIHYNGHRKNGPFVAINCGAIPENLMESELFGHKKGSFTGALNDYSGKFEQADGGTLFLDEVGTMRQDLQVKLLRVIQEKSVTPIGGAENLSLDVRIIAATNSKLETEVENGMFRSDLYHRLNVFSIELPPLRERKNDIAILAKYFIQKYARQYAKENLKISNEALNILLNYHYPGNIRELENILEKAVILSESDLIMEENVSLPSGSRKNDNLTEDIALPDVERKLIENALRENQGSIKASAISLGISYKTLQYRIKKYGIDKSSFKKP